MATKKTTAKARAVAERQAMDASGVRARSCLPPPPHDVVHYHARDPETDKIRTLCGVDVSTTGPTYSVAAVTCAKCRDLLKRVHYSGAAPNGYHVRLCGGDVAPTAQLFAPAPVTCTTCLALGAERERKHQAAEQAEEDKRGVNYLATRIASEAAMHTIGAGRALTDEQLRNAEDAARRIYRRWHAVK